jgi:hypothetical protein
MNSASSRYLIKELLRRFPRSAEIYQALRPGVVPTGSFALTDLSERLPSWIEACETAEPWTPENQRKRILVVGVLKWWFEYAIAIGLLLRTAGHKVDLAFLPYRRWKEPVPQFDVQRGVYYIENLLEEAEFPLGLKSLLAGSADSLPTELEAEIESQSRIDVQYTLQREELDFVNDQEDESIYKLRLGRNRKAAASAYDLLRSGNYDVVIIPNGSILELGAVYRVATHLGIPAVTYEFGEQRGRIWLAQDDEVMRQDTTTLWQAVGDIPLTVSERSEIEKLFEARRGGRTWEQFRRKWQTTESEGAQRTRAKLGLDPKRPIALLCTNVVGDSLALNRQVFTSGMAEWLRKTVTFFEKMPDYQLVVRVHPGEMLGAGHPSVDIIRNALPHQPEHVTVVPPESAINSYDLIEFAHLGLVYTTTIGLEMSMLGIPVIVTGETHYKGKGFTDDPGNWGEYISVLQKRLEEPQGRQLSDQAIEKAWRYAYRYFFDYPFDFPWHLITFWEDIDTHPFSEVLQVAKHNSFRGTMDAFIGHPIDWEAKITVQGGTEVPIEG